MSAGLASLPYNGLALDRAAASRADPGWVDAVLARPGSTVIPFWRDKCLVAGAGRQPVSLAGRDAGPVIDAAQGLVFLGLDGQCGVFAADLSPLTETAAAALAGASAAVDVRRLFTSLGAQQAAMLGYARGILQWHRQQRFCGACGAPARSQNGGSMRRCSGQGCGTLLFPRVEPAVIMLVESPESQPGPPRCLLARHRGSAAGAYATLAGFVELGECLEDAVRREVAEETGVGVGVVRYQGSQAWPFPAGLMAGFRARAVSTALSVDPAEIAEARWFTAAEAAALLAGQPGTGDSIEGYLIRDWLEEVS
jgi:NAD+ diphosphatase